MILNRMALVISPFLFLLYLLSPHTSVIHALNVPRRLMAVKRPFHHVPSTHQAASYASSPKPTVSATGLTAGRSLKNGDEERVSPVRVRLRLLRSHWRSMSISTLLALSTWMKAPTAAMADLPPNTVRMSLRPGITPDQIQRDLLTKKDMDARQRSGVSSPPQYFQLDHEQEVDALTKAGEDPFTQESIIDDSTSSSNRGKKTRVQEYDDEYMDLDDEDSDVDTLKHKESKRMALTTKSKKSLAMESSPQKSAIAQTVSSLSGAGPKLSEKAENTMVKKAILAMFGPILGVCFLREADRWNKEQKNVDKRIELLKLQRDEMKKQGSSNDEKKKKKKGSGDKDGKDGNNNNDDDDEDDDDDDDDEEDDKNTDEKNKRKK